MKSPMICVSIIAFLKLNSARNSQNFSTCTIFLQIQSELGLGESSLTNALFRQVYELPQTLNNVFNWPWEDAIAGKIWPLVLNFSVTLALVTINLALTLRGKPLYNYINGIFSSINTPPWEGKLRLIKFIPEKWSPLPPAPVDMYSNNLLFGKSRVF